MAYRRKRSVGKQIKAKKIAHKIVKKARMPRGKKKLLHKMIKKA